MAGGMLTKQNIILGARFLNDINDSVSGGLAVALPAGAPTPASSQTIPGDRIVLDDATAVALSDTTVGTLFGGIYMYFGTLSSSAASPARGAAAFFRAADLPSATTGLYQITADAQPSAAVPTFIAGVFINAITKGNWGWIQLAGVASCLFDSAITTAAVGNPVTVKVSPAVASTFNVGAVVTTATIPIEAVDALFGMAIVLPVISTVTAVLITRTPFPRI